MQESLIVKRKAVSFAVGIRPGLARRRLGAEDTEKVARRNLNFFAGFVLKLMNLHDEMQAFLLGTSLRQALPRYRKDWTLTSGGSKQVAGDAGGDSLLLAQPPRFILAASPPPLTDRLCSLTHAQ
jgi:hypothetical protein